MDSGKSTLSGRLLHLLGQISHKEMQKYEKEAKQQVIILHPFCKTQSNVYQFMTILLSIQSGKRVVCLCLGIG